MFVRERERARLSETERERRRRRKIYRFFLQIFFSGFYDDPSFLFKIELWFFLSYLTLSKKREKNVQMKLQVEYRG